MANFEAFLWNFSSSTNAEIGMSVLFLLFVKMLCNYNHHLCCQLSNFLGIQTTTCAFLEVRIASKQQQQAFYFQQTMQKILSPTTIGMFFVHCKDHHKRFNRICYEKNQYPKATLAIAYPILCRLVPIWKSSYSVSIGRSNYRPFYML